jgi:hypothetical protein
MTRKAKAAQAPRTFKRVSGPLRVDGDAYGAFYAHAFRDAHDREYIVLATKEEHLGPLFERLNTKREKAFTKRVAMVMANQVKRLK